VADGDHCRLPGVARPASAAVAVIEYRRGLRCLLCSEVVLEAEPLRHTSRERGGLCNNYDRDGVWNREQALVLLRSNLHQEVRWTHKCLTSNRRLWVHWHS